MSFTIGEKTYEFDLDDHGKYLASQIGRLNQEVTQIQQGLEEKQMALEGFTGRLRAHAEHMESQRTLDE
jgi:hypothetical protein